MRFAAAILFAMISGPGYAKVSSTGPAGFSVTHEAVVAASPDAVWKALLKPARWWSGDHSWTGKADNFSLSVQPGGCFCEKLPKGGFAEHARAIYAAPSQTLRLSGALGPLQSEALAGTLSVTLTPVEKGTSLRFDYVVGGHARFDLAELAPAVDSVIGEQHMRLKRLIETGKPAK